MKNHFFFLFSLLCAVLFFGSCNRRDHETPIDGVWTGNHYTNKRALFEVEMPEGLQLSAPKCIDHELNSLKSHAYRWDIISKKGKEGEIVYFEPASDDDHYDYNDIYRLYKENGHARHVERESIFKWLRMRIYAEMEYGERHQCEVNYARHDSQLIITYGTDNQYRNDLVEQMIDGMKVEAIYPNLAAGNSGGFWALWTVIILLVAYGVEEIEKTSVQMVMTILSIAIFSTLAWWMTGIACNFTYWLIGITDFILLVPHLRKSRYTNWLVKACEKVLDMLPD